MTEETITLVGKTNKIDDKVIDCQKEIDNINNILIGLGLPKIEIDINSLTKK